MAANFHPDLPVDQQPPRSTFDGGGVGVEASFSHMAGTAGSKVYVAAEGGACHEASLERLMQLEQMGKLQVGGYCPHLAASQPGCKVALPDSRAVAALPPPALSSARSLQLQGDAAALLFGVDDVQSGLQRSTLGLSNQHLSLQTFSRIASSMRLQSHAPRLALDAADNKASPATTPLVQVPSGAPAHGALEMSGAGGTFGSGAALTWSEAKLLEFKRELEAKLSSTLPQPDSALSRLSPEVVDAEVQIKDLDEVAELESCLSDENLPFVDANDSLPWSDGGDGGGDEPHEQGPAGGVRGGVNVEFLRYVNQTPETYEEAIRLRIQTKASGQPEEKTDKESDGHREGHSERQPEGRPKGHLEGHSEENVEEHAEEQIEERLGERPEEHLEEIPEEQPEEHLVEHPKDHSEGQSGGQIEGHPDGYLERPDGQTNEQPEEQPEVQIKQHPKSMTAHSQNYVEDCSAGPSPVTSGDPYSKEQDVDVEEGMHTPAALSLRGIPEEDDVVSMEEYAHFYGSMVSRCRDPDVGDLDITHDRPTDLVGEGPGEHPSSVIVDVCGGDSEDGSFKEASVQEEGEGDLNSETEEPEWPASHSRPEEPPLLDLTLAPPLPPQQQRRQNLNVAVMPRLPLTINGRAVLPEKVFPELAELLESGESAGGDVVRAALYQAVQVHRVHHHVAGAFNLGLYDKCKHLAPTCPRSPRRVDGDGGPPNLPVTDALNRELLLRVSCARCRAHVVPPMVHCEDGHFLCPDCRPAGLTPLSRCTAPSGCDAPLFTEPSRLFDTLARSLRYPCRFRELGCPHPAAMHYLDKARHEVACHHRQVRCYVGDCLWTGQWNAHKNHLMAHHLQDAVLGDWDYAVEVRGLRGQQGLRGLHEGALADRQTFASSRSTDLVLLGGVDSAHHLYLVHSLALPRHVRFAVQGWPRCQYRLRLTAKANSNATKVDGVQELEARGMVLRPDQDADLELRSGRSFRLDRDMFGEDPVDPAGLSPVPRGSVGHKTYLCLLRPPPDRTSYL